MTHELQCEELLEETYKTTKEANDAIGMLSNVHISKHFGGSNWSHFISKDFTNNTRNVFTNVLQFRFHSRGSVLQSDTKYIQ